MYKPDEYDWKIIGLLNEDGRMPSAEIARILDNVSARTVTNRINALKENGIINIRAVVNPEAVGYNVMADVLVDVEPGRVREVARRAAEFPVLLGRQMSAYHYECEVLMSSSIL